jgi:hypothetical protein
MMLPIISHSGTAPPTRLVVMVGRIGNCMHSAFREPAESLGSPASRRASQVSVIPVLPPSQLTGHSSHAIILESVNLLVAYKCFWFCMAGGN